MYCSHFNINYLGKLPVSTLLIGYYHGLLLRDTNADSLFGGLYSTGLLSAQEQNIILSGHSCHHRNWLLLEHIRHMDSQALLTFSELVKNVWPQIGMQLIIGMCVPTYVGLILTKFWLAQKEHTVSMTTV